MKYLIGIAVLAGLGFGAYHWQTSGPRKQSAQSQPLVVQTKRGPLQITIESTGTVEPKRAVEIKCEASGEITKLPVDVSDVVKKGDLLVQLDPQDEKLLVKRAEVSSVVAKARLEQAKLALKIAQQNLANSRTRSKATLASAEVLAEETAAQLERSEQLYKKKITSKQALQSARTTHAQATEALEAAKVSLKELDTEELQVNSLRQAICVAEQEVVTSEIDLDEARERLRETTVQSPMDGIVTTRGVQIGQIISSGTNSVSGGTTVLYLADMSKMYVLVSVDESDIGRVRKGQKVRVTADAFPKRAFEGTIVRVASRGISSSNVVTFEVKVEVTSQEKNLLKPGMTANVEIVVVDKKDTLRAPSGAIQQTSKQCFVTKLNADKTTSKIEITIGETDGDWTEILSGLKEGDQLVVSQQKKSLWRSDKQSSQSMSSRILSVGGSRSGGPPR